MSFPKWLLFGAIGLFFISEVWQILGTNITPNPRPTIATKSVDLGASGKLSVEPTTAVPDSKSRVAEYCAKLHGFLDALRNSAPKDAVHWLIALFLGGLLVLFASVFGHLYLDCFTIKGWTVVKEIVGHILVISGVLSIANGVAYACGWTGLSTNLITGGLLAVLFGAFWASEAYESRAAQANKDKIHCTAR